MTHLNNNCPESCGFDASKPEHVKNACNGCFRNPKTDTRVDMGKDIWGNTYSGTTNPDGTVNTYVNGELLVRGKKVRNVNKPQWGQQ